jgi:cell division protein ZapB
MDAELDALQEKINQFVELCQRLRAENVQLRQQLASELDQNKRLEDKITGAKTRLETLLGKIPEESE